MEERNDIVIYRSEDGLVTMEAMVDPSVVVKGILITAQSGARGLSEDKVLYYNLDVILSKAILTKWPQW